MGAGLKINAAFYGNTYFDTTDPNFLQHGGNVFYFLAVGDPDMGVSRRFLQTV